MRAVDIIIKKRDRLELSDEEINFFVQGYVSGEIPDYQASAWAMAVLLNGMTDHETTALTLAMADSGERLDLSEVAPLAVDKHSTGGVGDKVTLIIAPVVASCGLPIGKMSGRGLGFSGGTLDKLESIPGYRVNLTKEEFLRQLKDIGIVVTGQSADLAPADGKFYALRDVTGTVPSLPLIAASVMSKKIAGGAHAIILDVKTGIGAFMQTLEGARELATLMVSIGKIANRKVAALISDMNQPLGCAIGNALELKEAIDILHGHGPSDLREHCLTIASWMLVLGEKANTLETAREMVEDAISQGRAWEKFRQWIRAQRGDVRYVDEPERLPAARLIKDISALQSGYICMLNAREIGETSVGLGAGRAKKGDSVDHAVGIIVHRKVGDQVQKGEPVFSIYANDEHRLTEAQERLLIACQISDQPYPRLPLFYDVIPYA
ncbi:MAG: pyrimidine-nucleoside phosphorylase [Anaerolineaceae bacterium]|nr:pyrimidine-nucleoside phosphorylase [Anaerolineaceae bacterium]